jgi:transcription elongation GreA/GreB family factor
MSSAFVREPDEPRTETPPERPVSTHPNFVTARGLKLIERTLAELEAKVAACADEHELAWLRRDQRYWAARRASAQVIESVDEPGEVAFGTRVSFRRDGRAPETVELVGEDEADPAAGRLSWVSPLGQAMLGAEPGDVVELAARTPPAQVEVLSVAPLRRLN